MACSEQSSEADIVELVQYNPLVSFLHYEASPESTFQEQGVQLLDVELVRIFVLYAHS